uniref:Uncharacterized protein n=1 Tax=Cyprinus carpio TaxID=7962 RepID=A0A8C1VWM6_CYPCA
ASEKCIQVNCVYTRECGAAFLCRLQIMDTKYRTSSAAIKALSNLSFSSPKFEIGRGPYVSSGCPCIISLSFISFHLTSFRSRQFRTIIPFIWYIHFIHSIGLIR